MKKRILSLILVIPLMLSIVALSSCHNTPDTQDSGSQGSNSPVFERPASWDYWNSSMPLDAVTPDGQKCDSVFVEVELEYQKPWLQSQKALTRVEISWEPESLLAVIAFGISLPYEEIDGKRVFYLDVTDLQWQYISSHRQFYVQLYLPKGFYLRTAENNGEITVVYQYENDSEPYTTQLKYNYKSTEFLLLADDERVAWLPTFTVIPDGMQFTGELRGIPGGSVITACFVKNYGSISARSLEGLSKEEINDLKPTVGKTNSSRTEIYRYNDVKYYICESWDIPRGENSPTDFDITWEWNGRWYVLRALSGIITSMEHAEEIIRGIQNP